MKGYAWHQRILISKPKTRNDFLLYLFDDFFLAEGWRKVRGRTAETQFALVDGRSGRSWRGGSSAGGSGLGPARRRGATVERPQWVHPQSGIHMRIVEAYASLHEPR